MPDSIRQLKHVIEVAIGFRVGENGRLSEIQIYDEEITCSSCAAAALAFVKKMPKWVPAHKKDKRGKTKFYSSYESIVVRFGGN